MKKLCLIAIISIVFAASGLRAAFTEDFDTFSLGALVAQESWEAHATVTVETTATSGEYVGGKALKTNASGDEWPRHDATGVALGLTLDKDGIEYGFDMREDVTSAVSAYLFMRQGRTANYGIAVGLSGGSFAIRPNATSGDTFTGNWIGSGGATVWEKGDWIRIWVELTGVNFSTASVYCYNLTKGVEIPTGLLAVDTGVDYLSKASSWTGFNLRLTSSTGTFVDNLYIQDYTAPVAPEEGMYAQNFDAFTLGVLTEQDSWEANANLSVIDTTTDGAYTGGRALQSTTYTDKTVRNVATGVDFGLDPVTFDGVEYGFDMREDVTTLSNMRLYLRAGRTATYTPSFGLASGIVRIRTNGEGGSDVYGNDLSKSPYYGAEGTGYWEKGEWLQFKLILTGPEFDYATVLAYNLSRGGVEIPTGITNIKLNANPLSKLSSVNTCNLRGGSTSTLIDNVYVKDYTNDSVYAILPSPEDGAYPVAIDGGVTLSWLGVPTASSHKVYFGLSTDTLTLETDTTEESYLLPYTLEKGVTYYWRVDEVIAGEDNTGLVWSFTTELDALNYPRRMAYEGFDYTAYLQLSQTPNNGGFGWDSKWERAAGGWCYVQIGPGSLTPAMDYLLGTTGNKVQHIAGGINDDGMRQLSYPIDARADQDYYISYLAMGDWDIYNNVTFGLFEAKNGAYLFQSHMMYEGYPGVNTPQFALRDDQGGWTDKLFGSWSGGEVYVVVVKISSSAAGDDVVSMSAFSATNPLPTEEPVTWDQTFTTQSNKVYPWVYINGRASASDKWYVDEIQVGTGWGAVTGWASACGDFGTIMSYDLNQDCTIDFGDYAVMAADWLKCTDPAIDGCEWVIAENDPNFTSLFTTLSDTQLSVYENDSITIDGDLSEWGSVRWYNSMFTSGYQVANIGDVTDAQVALKWDPTIPDTVYVAVQVTDTNQSFASAPTQWNSGDNIEIRFSVNDTSTDTNWYDNATYDIAQYYQIFPQSAGVYANFGPMLAIQDALVYSDIEVAVSTDGDVITYEIALPCYSSYNINTQSGTAYNLSDGDVVAFNFQINSVNGTEFGGLFADQGHAPDAWPAFTVTTNGTLPLGAFGFFGADIDKNGEVGTSDLDTLAEEWLSCTDPEIAGCDQPWLP